jgi:hypothetical protein
LATRVTAKQIHQRQLAYVERLKSEGGLDLGLTIAGAFVRSIRDLGYRHSGTALDELIDNAIEAAAKHVHLAFGFAESEAKPVALAVIDDGWGMVPDMVRASVVWGGTDREDSRSGFGRFGYGLPSAAVSQGRRFSVFSRTGDADFYSVSLDVDEISEGKYIRNGRVTVPRPRRAVLPEWVKETAAEDFPGGLSKVRTVVLIENLDRLTWKTMRTLERNLLEHFGITYRNFLREVEVVVNGKVTEPLDPLFTTAGARFWDFDDDKAEPFDPIEFDVKDADDRRSQGTVKVRFSYMPPTFQRKDKNKGATANNANPRFAVMKDHNGIVVLRNGRQIDVVTRTPEVTFVNFDRNIGVEIDFPPGLDDEFQVTTAKQQIVISNRMWDLLKQHGLWRTVDALRRRFREERADFDSSWDADSASDMRPAEVVMEELEAHKRATAINPGREQEGEENLAKEVNRLHSQTGIDSDKLQEALRHQTEQRRFKVTREALPGAPFYRVEQRGSQQVLRLNTSHRFFTDVYAAVGGSEGSRLRAALDLLLLIMGDCELDSTDETRQFYRHERNEWSVRLETALERLESRISSNDREDIDDKFVVGV